MVDMDVVIEPKSDIDRSTDLGFKYIKVENMEGLRVSSIGCAMEPEKSTTIVQQPTKKTFSRVVKAVFFETTLVSLFLALVFDIEIHCLSLVYNEFKSMLFTGEESSWQ